MSLNINANIKFKNDSEKKYVNKNFRSKVANIINIITTELCNNQNADIDAIKLKIKNKYNNYKKFCKNKECKNDSDIIFNDDRINSLIDQLNNNNDFKKKCRIKKKLVFNYIPSYPYVLPFVIPSFFIQNGGSYNVVEANDYSDNGFAKIVNEDGTTLTCRYVDFDEFEREYETVKDKSNLSDEIKNAYNAIKELDKELPTWNEAKKVISLVLKFINYYTLPQKTLNKLNQI
jgi:hypothetical protein